MKTSAVISSNMNCFRHINGLIILALILLATACGRMGDPLPPIRFRPLVPETLQVVQRGDALILSWPKPGVVAMQRSSIIRAEILRREEKATEAKRLPEDKFLEDARIVGTVTAREIAATEASQLQFSDGLPSNITDPDLRFRYAVRYVNVAGAPLPLSNYAFLEPVTAIAEPPNDLKIALSQESIKLSWAAPLKNLDGSEPALVVGYNIYRRDKEKGFPSQPLNATPITTNSFEDRKFKFETDYTYIVRSLSQGKEMPIEGPSSTEITLHTKDSFPPLAPTNVTGAAAAGIVSIFWPTNSERDLKGYLVYRTESGNSAAKEAVKLTPTPIPTTTFRDEKGEVGKSYIYYITAVDIFGNESEFSNRITITVVQ